MMMNGEMMNGEMMWAMGLVWLLVILLLVVSIAALVKYLFIVGKYKNSTTESRSDARLP